jgi:putative Mn2+ efflux pump MntP
MGWLKNLVKSLLGWFGMTLLVSLGAPFWYDFLKTVMGFKNSFKEQAENKNQKEGG